jgi:NitT/TauT family transport system substrate-binding protein
LCATDPEQAARRLVEGGFALHDETALQTLTDLPYNLWRELDPKDSLRFYALWLHEFGMLNSTPTRSSPRAPTGTS